jgi:hypothetical protein
MELDRDGEPWTLREDALLRTDSDRKIAAGMRRSSAAVSTRRTKLGIKWRAPRPAGDMMEQNCAIRINASANTSMASTPVSPQGRKHPAAPCTLALSYPHCVVQKPNNDAPHF